MFSLKYELGQGIVVYLGAILVVAAIGQVFFFLSTKLTGDLILEVDLFWSIVVGYKSNARMVFWIIPFVVLFYSLYSFAPKSLWISFGYIILSGFADIVSQVVEVLFSNGRESLFIECYSRYTVSFIFTLGFICVIDNEQKRL